MNGFAFACVDENNDRNGRLAQYIGFVIIH